MVWDLDLTKKDDWKARKTRELVQNTTLTNDTKGNMQHRFGNTNSLPALHVFVLLGIQAEYLRQREAKLILRNAIVPPCILLASTRASTGSVPAPPAGRLSNKKSQ